jgi:hypothetical protein
MMFIRCCVTNVIQTDPQSDAMQSEETETCFHTVLLYEMAACLFLPTNLPTTYHTTEGVWVSLKLTCIKKHGQRRETSAVVLR